MHKMRTSISVIKEDEKAFRPRDTAPDDCKWVNKSEMLKIKAQFKGIQIKVLNIFTLAKNQLSSIYQKILTRIKRIQKNLYTQSSKVSPQFWTLLQDMQNQLQQKTTALPTNIENTVISPFNFDHLLTLMLDNCTSQNFLTSNKRINSSMSSGNRLTQKTLNQTVGDLDNISTNQYKTALRIRPNQKRVENLGTLSGKWDVLEELILENKKISLMVPLSTVLADTLQEINLRENQLYRLDFMIQAEYPILRSLNLSKNLICTLEGLQNCKLPNLKVLNLCQNKIKNLHPLQQCQFPELAQLNLSQNRIQKPQPLILCTFPKLQILNIDNNQIKQLDFIINCTFYRLKILSFCYNQIKSIQCLKRCRLHRLQALLGYNNRVQDIACLEFCQFPMLREIVLNNNYIQDIGVVGKLKFNKLVQFDLENNRIRPKEILCFVTKNDQCKKAKKRYPFIQL